MKFYRHWARGEATVHGVGEPFKLRAYGGSNEGLEAALRRAEEIASRAAAAFEKSTSLGPYGYADRAVREEIIQEFEDTSGLSAVITRNSYGALILNTNRVMFVDVDYPAPSFRGLIGTLWDSLRGRPTPARTDRDKQMLEVFDQVVLSRPELGIRIYRTAGGYRLLVTSQTYDPVSSDAVDLLTAFGSDPLYVKLCKVQECFRARLSAKPWRCGLTVPPTKFPWVTPEHEPVTGNGKSSTMRPPTNTPHANWLAASARSKYRRISNRFSKRMIGLRYKAAPHWPDEVRR